MTEHTYRLTLRSDVALTAQSATIGEHRTLRHVPGAQLLGAAAKALYAKLDPDDAFTLFHSGKVRFGDARPTGPDGAPTLPMPAAWHFAKGGEETTLWNLARAEREDVTTGGEKRQPKQLREGFVTAALVEVKPRTRFALKTAVDSDGRARDGFLFGVEALVAGQTFVGRVSVDDGVTTELWSKLERALTGAIRIGRSRSAEFGDVRLEWLPDAPVDWTPTDAAAPGVALFLCASDVALRDANTGAPTLEPDPKAFDLEGWTFDPARSFLRYRSYSPFNGFRKRPDTERQVLTAGSVIAFAPQGEAALDDQKVRSALARGVGEHRQEGLGEVVFEPALLAAARDIALTAEPKREKEQADKPQAAALKDPLAEWAEASAKAARRDDDAWDFAHDSVGRFAEYGLPRSQWGEVRRIACGQRDFLALRAALLRFVNDGVRALDRAWGRSQKGKRAGEALLDFIDDAAKDPNVKGAESVALELLAIHAARRGRQNGRAA